MVGLLRAIPIRWRILSIAALNSAVVIVLAVLIWNGARVLGSAWEDVLGRSKNPEDVPEFLVQRTEGGDSAGNSARIGGTSIRKFIRAR